MSFKDALDEGKEPEPIFHVNNAGDDIQPWRTGMSETTVQEVAEQEPDKIFFVAKEDEVFE